MSKPTKEQVDAWLRWLWPVAVILLHDYLGVDIPNMPQGG